MARCCMLPNMASLRKGACALMLAAPMYAYLVWLTTNQCNQLLARQLSNLEQCFTLGNTGMALGKDSNQMNDWLNE